MYVGDPDVSFLKTKAPTALCFAVMIGLSGCDNSGDGTTPAPVDDSPQASTAANVETPAADVTPAAMTAEADEHGHAHDAAGGHDEHAEAPEPATPTPRELELEKMLKQQQLQVKNLEEKLSHLTESRPAPTPGDTMPAPVSRSPNTNRDGISPQHDDSKADPAHTRHESSSSGASNPLSSRRDPGKVDSTVAMNKDVKQPQSYKDFGDPVINVSSPELHLGQIPTGGSRTGTITLTNSGDRAYTLQKCKTSCGCTTTNCKVGEVLEPGASMDVSIKLTGGTVERALRKTVTFLFLEHPPVQMVVAGDATAFVKIEPARLDPMANNDGRVTLTATDGQPFSVKGITPPIIDPAVFPTESGVEHELFIDWKKWEALGGRQRRVNFTIDHPETQRITTAIYIRPKPGDRGPRPGATAANQDDATNRGGAQSPPSVDTQRPGGDRPVAKPTEPVIDADLLLRENRIDELVKLIQEGKIDVNKRGRSGRTLLLGAAQSGQLELCEVLIDASADVEAADTRGFTALMYAIDKADVEIVRFLLDAGADIASRDQIGNTPLNWAAWKSTPEIVKELINAGGFINDTESITGYAPLIWSCFYGQTGVTQVLLDAGADIEIRDKIEGATPLMFALRRTGGDPIQHMRMMLDAGADIEATTKQGQTPFLVGAASASTSVEALKMLVEAGANVNAVDADGANAMDLAQRRVDSKASDVIEYLKTVMAPAGE
jgi:ankyrin repeat protein